MTRTLEFTKIMTVPVRADGSRGLACVDDGLDYLGRVRHDAKDNLPKSEKYKLSETDFFLI